MINGVISKFVSIKGIVLYFDLINKAFKASKILKPYVFFEK